MKKVDVVVIGAGLNGLIAALALGGKQALRPLTVTIIDQFDPKRFATANYDSRASALTRATQTMFGVLGIWPAVKDHAQDMTDIIVTDADGKNSKSSLLNFASAETGQPPAAMVENHHLFAAALAEIEKSPHIELMSGQSLTDISFGPGLAQVTLASGEVVKASLVVGADGRNSWTRGKAGLKLTGWDYPHSALTLTIGHELAHGGQAEEHFTPNGVFAVLPLKGNRSSLVWTEPHDEAKRIHGLSEAEFMAALQLKFGSHRGKLELLSARHVYPLSMKLADAMTGPRLALLGDAAHVIHPLAGLGLNLGFKDAAALADCVHDALTSGQDIGGDASLERYKSWRRFDTVSTAYLLDGLNKLFSNDNLALRVLRDAGLKMVDISPPLKSFFMKEAAGQSGNLPSLMRGLVA